MPIYVLKHTMFGLTNVWFCLTDFFFKFGIGYHVAFLTRCVGMSI